MIEAKRFDQKRSCSGVAGQMPRSCVRRRPASPVRPAQMSPSSAAKVRLGGISREGFSTIRVSSAPAWC